MQQRTGTAGTSLSRKQIGLRRISAWLARYVFPRRFSDPYQGLARAEQLNREGYGLVLVINHFSTRDGLQALQLIFASPVLAKRLLLAPVAYHQYDRYGRLIRFLARQFGVQLQPVVTGDTVKELGDHFQRGQGLVDYLASSSDSLRGAGIVLLAPQGGRRSRLGQPGGRPVGHLLAHAKRCGVAEVALLPIGLSIPDVLDYGDPKLRGFNFGRLYLVSVGRAVTLEELIREVGRLRLVDGWIFDGLAALVPESYLQPPGPEPAAATDTGTAT